MSLDNNCCKDRNGNLLPYYLPWPTPNSSGVNVFAQPLPFEHNVSVFLLLSRQALCSGFSFINTRVLPLPLSFLVYTLIIGVQYFRQEQQIFFCSTNRVIWLSCLSHSAFAWSLLQTQGGGSVLSNVFMNAFLCRLSIPGNLSTIFLLVFNLPKQQ